MMRKVVTVTLGAIVLGAILAGLACSSSSESEGDPESMTGSSPSPTPTPGARRSYGSPPPMTIDTSKTYTATLETEKGNIVIELAAADAPRTVNNFVFLAREGYYDGVTFHRVLPGFMAQSGDPTGTGSGGPGYRFEDEFSPGLRHERGVISMANVGPNTNGSQFFITYVPTPHLDDVHSVFGRVIEGMDVLESITPRDPGQNPQFLGDRIDRVTIAEE